MSSSTQSSIPPEDTNSSEKSRTTVPGTISVQEAATTEPNEVHLYVYDLSRGFAKSFSSVLLGQQLEGIWHTSVVVYQEEFFFGAGGVTSCPPCGTILGRPTHIHPLGSTHLPRDVVDEQLLQLRETSFQGATYDLFHHNCNHFSEEFASFLCGQGIPTYILNLSETVKDTPIGKLIQRFSENYLVHQPNPNAQSSLDDTNSSTAQQQLTYNPSPLEDLIREGVLQATGLGATMGDSSDEGTPPRANIKRRDLMAEVQEEEKREMEEKKKNREPPIVFRDICSSIDELLDDLEKSLAKVELNEEEMRCLKELREYSVGDEGSWVLSDDFLGLIARILIGGEAGIGDDSKVFCCKILAWLAVTKDDVILVLHQDRRDHIIMRYANNIDQMSPPCQEAVALLLCNLFENLSTSEWLLYISEWDNEGKGATSNIRVTTKIGVHALLSKELKDVGSALIYNIVTKEVKSAIFDDVAVELAMALLQFMSEKPVEALLWRGLKSLLRCCQLARSEVPGLVKMVGPPPSNSRGASPRCDEIITSIETFLKSVP
ncbi:uncharacterized protein LOC110852407 isoform X2 [Folsomia candida]|uniref:uncharacterized protein LOC110852407 isoform X2 n=1 Tax=Folsomia candida TaxID=158441 RepID=UPI000B901774|nr:uncharacterized protein LOC110852407 isoform X2 [Folsomia candida]